MDEFDGPSNRGWIFELTPSQLRAIRAGEAVAPKVSIDPAFAGLNDLKFDQAGNLWVVNSGTFGSPGTAKIVEYTPAQFGKRVNPAPNIIIGPNPGDQGDEDSFGGMRFDAAGDLWIAAHIQSSSGGAGSSGLLKFTPDQLQASGWPSPALTVERNDGEAIGNPCFDSQGNLWVSRDLNLDLYSASDLSGSGVVTPTPIVSLEPDLGFGVGNAEISGIDLDESGDLWAATIHGFIGELTPTQSAHSGSPVAEVIIGANRHGTNFDPEFPKAITFGPSL